MTLGKAFKQTLTKTTNWAHYGLLFALVAGLTWLLHGRFIWYLAGIAAAVALFYDVLDLLNVTPKTLWLIVGALIVLVCALTVNWSYLNFLLFGN